MAAIIYHESHITNVIANLLLQLYGSILLNNLMTHSLLLLMSLCDLMSLMSLYKSKCHRISR